MTTAILLTLLTIATARITRLITLDTITAPLRHTITRHTGTTSKITYLAHCPWCMSIWIATLLTPTCWYLTDLPTQLHITSWIGLPLTTLTVAHLAALLCLIGRDH